MKIGNRLINIFNAAFSRGNPQDPVIASWFGAGAASSGEMVTAESAMTISAVYACVRYISQSLGSLPFPVYQRDKDGGKSRALNHYLYPVLNRKPNGKQTPMAFREMMTAHCLLRGNAYALIIGNGAPVTELIPLHPDRVEIIYQNGKRFYRYQPVNGAIVVYGQDAILHLMGLTLDGETGITPISYMAETFGTAMAAEKFAGRFFKNDATSGVYLKMPGRFKDKMARDNFKESFNAARTGGNQHKTIVLEDGLEMNNLGLTNKDSQFLESRQFGKSDIASIFGVPPHKIGDLTRGTFSNIEHQAIEAVVDCIRPWAVRWEQTVNLNLITESNYRSGIFAEILLDGLLRGDMASRYAAYSIGRQNGFLSANDVRALENMNPVEGGDIYLIPLNMVPANKAGADKSKQIIKAAAARAAHKEITAIAKERKKKFGEEFAKWADDFYAKHALYLAEAFACSPEVFDSVIAIWKTQSADGDIEAAARVAEIIALMEGKW